MAEPEAGIEFSAGGVVADSRYYAGAVEALRSSCAHIGEAADAAQRARFFSDITGWNDEADASAHDADKAAVMAMAEALRAKGAVAAYADAARSTLAEVTAAFAAPDSPSSAIVGAGATDADGAEGSEEDNGAFSGHLARALVALVEEREREIDSESDEAGYVKMANTLSVLAGARSAYRAVDEALVLLANARIAYLKDSLAAAQTALAADLKTAVADDIRATSIGEFRSALTTLAVTRTAYNAEVADELWGALAEAGRIWPRPPPPSSRSKPLPATAAAPTMFILHRPWPIHSATPRPPQTFTTPPGTWSLRPRSSGGGPKSRAMQSMPCWWRTERWLPTL